MTTEEIDEVAQRAARKALEGSSEAWGRMEALYSQLDGKITKLGVGLEEVKERVGRLEVGQEEIKERVGRLEVGQERIKVEIRRVDERLDGLAGQLHAINLKIDRVTDGQETRLLFLEAKAQ